MQNAKGGREVIRVRKRSLVSYEKACFFTKTGTRGMDVHSKQKLKHCKRIQCHDGTDFVFYIVKAIYNRILINISYKDMVSKKNTLCFC